jgi:hypothetical protein
LEGRPRHISGAGMALHFLIALTALQRFFNQESAAFAYYRYPLSDSLFHNLQAKKNPTNRRQPWLLLKTKQITLCENLCSAGFVW